MSFGSGRSRAFLPDAPAVVRWTICLGAVLVCLHLGSSLLRAPTLPAPVDEVLQDTCFLIAAVSVWLRAVAVPTNRRAWVLVAASLTVYATADITYYAVVQHLDPEPFPSVADALWLWFFPLIYVAIILLLRSAVVDWRLSVWVDGVLAALALSALSVGLVFRPLLDAGDGAFDAVLVNLAYPVADLVLLALLTAGYAMLGWHVRGSLALLGLGMVVFTVADVIYLLRVATTGYVPHTWLDALWLVAVLCVAAAAWADNEPPPARRHEGRLLLAQPVLFLVTSDALVVYEAMQPDGPDPVVIVFAGFAIAVACLRMLLTVREVRALSDARRLAHTDELTGLPNRRRFAQELERLEGDGFAFAVMLLDLNGFKAVNDTFGHAVGDQLLAAVAVRLRRVVSARGGLCARMGGDEFGVLLPGAGEAVSTRVASEMLQTLRLPVRTRGFLLHINASIGIAVSPKDGTGGSTLLRRADGAMYRAKRSHLGYAAYQEGVDEDASARLRTVDELREALELGQIVPYYQPQLDLGTGQVVAFEALARWVHPQRGVIGPRAFLPLAEQAGLMPALAERMLTCALDDLRTWLDRGYDVAVAINLSSANVQDVTLPERIEYLLTDAGVPASALKCEITEDTLMTDVDQHRVTLGRLDEMGVQLSIDDYGTGYSSLSLLPSLPIRELKLDRSFVERMRADERTRVVVQSTIELAHRLGVSIVAEGIEREDELEHLTDWGCDVGQGFLFHRPMSADGVDTWLRECSVSTSDAGRSRPPRVDGAVVA